MRYEILENGDLEITGDISADAFEFPDSDSAMYEAFEPLTANGLMWVAPEDIGALTSAPILSDGTVKDNGDLDIEGAHVWWYPNYALRSPLRELIETGKTIFTAAKEA